MGEGEGRVLINCLLCQFKHCGGRLEEQSLLFTLANGFGLSLKIPADL